MTTSDLAAVDQGADRPLASRAQLAALTALLAAHALLVWLSRAPGIATGGDEARYLLLGQALRHLRYVEYWQVGWPVHSLYPPAFPLLLAVWGLVAGNGFDAQIVLSVAISVAALAAAWYLVARHLSPQLALLAVAALAFNPALVSRAGTVASEIPYALWSLLTLVALLERRTGANAAIATGLAIVAALTRTAGATLVAATILTLLLQRRFRSAAWATLAAALALGPWLAWTAVAPNQHVGTSYVADAFAAAQRQRGFGLAFTLMRRLAQNAAGYAVSVVDATLPYPDLIPGRADAWAWLVVAVAGLGAGLVAAWRRWQPVVIYLLLYAALLLYWPWPVDRFLEPVALLAAPLWLFGLLTLARRALTRGWMVPVLVAGGIVATTSAWISAGQARRQVECRRGPALPGPGRCLYPAQQDFLAATVWLRDSSAADARVLTVKPGDSYWYARREAVSFNAATSRSAAPLSQYLRAEHVSYVVLTTVTASERTLLAELLAGACGDLSVAATVAPQAYILRVRGAAEADSTNACAAVADYRSAVADSLRSKRWQ